MYYILTTINMRNNILIYINMKRSIILEKQELLMRMESLSDETRLNIVDLLSKNGEMCACELLDKLSISQGTLSHHMKDLVNSGIVSCKKDGKWCHYKLENDSICEVADYLEGLCCLKGSECSCSCCKK